MNDKTYIICATPRSGSYLLAYGLDATGLAGHPDEYFEIRGMLNRVKNMGVQVGGFEDYVHHLRDNLSSPNGIFGAKVMWSDMQNCFSYYIGATPGSVDADMPARMRDLFGDLQYVFITRQNKVRQAISLVKASQTQIWMERNQPESTALPKRETEYNFKVIKGQYDTIRKMDEHWRNYFTNGSIEPLIVVYEDMAANFHQTILNVLEFLNIPIPDGFVPPDPTLKKQADAVSDEWHDHFLSDLTRWESDPSTRDAFQDEIDALRKRIASLEAEISILRDASKPERGTAVRKIYRTLVPLKLRLRLRDFRENLLKQR